MCIFSGPVAEVAGTKIFARGSAQGNQFLVYSMRYAAADALAMILPLPTPAHPPEDALRFVDFSGYGEFFDDLDNCFAKTRSRDFGAEEPSGSLLTVYSVGSFEASFVPHRQDFARLDSRFRLPDSTWDTLPQYADYSFAVFKLKPGAQSVHPMAFEFPRCHPDQLFFPTLHIHQGVVEESAHFDHALYWQATYTREQRIHIHGSRSADYRVTKMVDIARAQGVVAQDTPLYRLHLSGMYENGDLTIPEGGV
ncbi:MAG: hypothetical protein KJZ86_11505 [Caldilineaceae bacterium]|nr:hypothetical protein [Caldilineaceae bacterium]HRJ41241.1 hypothetical protein [Caldilineaceae bacterium]